MNCTSVLYTSSVLFKCTVHRFCTSVLNLRHKGGHGVDTPVRAIESPDLAAVLGVVVDEHVLRETEQRARVHQQPGGDGDLEQVVVNWEPS